MKRTTKVLIGVAVLAVIYTAAVLVYLAGCPRVGPADLGMDPLGGKSKAKDDFRDFSTWDTLRLEAPVLVIEAAGPPSNLPDGYVEVGSPHSEEVNHRLVISKRFAKKLVMRTRSDTLFLTVNSEGEACDFKYYADDLKALICRSQHMVSLVGLRAKRFHIETQQEKVGVYDSCRIGELSTLSNQFFFVNNCVIDELKSASKYSFRYQLEDGCVVRKHHLLGKWPG